ncbi:Ribosomal protein S12p Asp88 methylthio transferase [Salmonella enterica subsp. enterica serovar Sanjuan]|uniref:Ribosomal protein S12p Asp88 methylthio transferase n=1 Tax=Salmonella enterica subsp. enterica serovar Sanjuan TaxID=1160765 RepID=A0A447NY25_SALET|nr:Ribosomal protein S12p Asp88 methylthio transferase [Salmonella enterica subsp. enterica serovar Sanjuan]
MSNVTHQPKIGFVSLGCPKNLVDSERILTELRTEGYDVVPRYDDADMVIVNTCGFIDSAVQESLEAIGEALNENGKVIVTGCLGAKRRSDPRSASESYWKSPGRIAMSKFCSTYIITYRSRSTIHF